MGAVAVNSHAITIEFIVRIPANTGTAVKKFDKFTGNRQLARRDRPSEAAANDDCS